MASDLRLKKIKIRNWATIREACIEFPESGLVLVRGNNIASDGHLDGVGAGKTNFGTALSRAILGVPEKPISKFSRNKDGDTYVKVDTTLNGNPFVVEIGLKCKELSRTGEGIQFSVNGQDPISRSHIGLTKEELIKTVGISPGLAKWTSWVDGEKLKFDDLSQKEAIDLLMTALHQPSWSSVQKNSSGVVDYFSDEIHSAEVKLESASSNAVKLKAEISVEKSTLSRELKAYNDSCEKAQQRIDEAERDLASIHANLENANIQLKDIKRQIQEIEESSAQEYAGLESSRLEIDGLLRVQKDKVRKLEISHSSCRDERRSLESALKKPKECPTCKREWPQDDEHRANTVEKVRLATDKETKSRELFEAEKGVEIELQEKLDNIDLRIRKMNVRSRTKALSDQYSDVEVEVRNISNCAMRQISTVEKLKSPVDRSSVAASEARLETKTKDLEETELEIEKISGDVADLRASLSVVKFWHSGFGPTGIPNMVLRDTIEPLNEIARRTAQVLCGGMINVKFSAEKEMASGEEKDELVVHIENVLGSGDLDTSSKGERCLSNLIISETLADLSAVHQSLGFCWYDEVTTNLPSSVKATLGQFFREKAERNNQLIFVVDHGMEIANYAHHVLIVEKTLEGSTVRWQR